MKNNLKKKVVMSSLRSTQKSWISNGTQVIVKMKNGTSIHGIVVGGDYNVCTFDKEYDVEYIKDGLPWTMIGVPERAITIKA